MDETRRLIERAQRSAEDARHVAAETKRLVRASREIQHWTARVQGRVAGEVGAFFSFNRLSNRLLGLLPSTEFERLAPQLHGVTFTSKQILHHADSPIEYLYFPISGLLSGAIEYGRGRVRIVDRAKLRSLACECYGAINREFARLFDSNGTDSLGWPPVA